MTNIILYHSLATISFGPVKLIPEADLLIQTYQIVSPIYS